LNTGRRNKKRTRMFLNARKKFETFYYSNRKAQKMQDFHEEIDNRNKIDGYFHVWWCFSAKKCGNGEKNLG
jgi:hypothetical protein